MKWSLHTFNKFILINNVTDYWVQMWVFLVVGLVTGNMAESRAHVSFLAKTMDVTVGVGRNSWGKWSHLYKVCVSQRNYMITPPEPSWDQAFHCNLAKIKLVDNEKNMDPKSCLCGSVQDRLNGKAKIMSWRQQAKAIHVTTLFK